METYGSLDRMDTNLAIREHAQATLDAAEKIALAINNLALAVREGNACEDDDDDNEWE